MLTLLELSAAFDTVDHGMLLRRLETSYGRFSSHLSLSLVLSRLDYGNLALAGLHTRELSRAVSPECWRVAHFFRQTCTITFHRYYVTFTGCRRRSESTARLPFSCIGVCTDLLRCTVDLRSIKDLSSRQRLRSWLSDTLAVPMSKLSTVGHRAFSDCRCTSVEHSVAGCSVIHFFINFQDSFSYEASLTKMREFSLHL